MDTPEKQNIEFRLLHLYDDLMNLYGDWANVEILAREINARGYKTAVDRKSVGDAVDFNVYSFIYIGSGTERSLRACMRDMARHKEAFIGRIETGICVLATGNSHELFGRAVTEAGEDRYETLNLLDFETWQTDSRITGDCVYKASFLSDRLVGFINRAGHGQEGDIDRPFYTELGPGTNDTSNVEGILYKNLLGTYMTGPVLVRNPPLLNWFADLICPDQGARRLADETLFTSQRDAYKMALSELSDRIGKR